jgi:hypothetical protein
MLGRTPFRLSRAYIIPIVIVVTAVLIGAGVRLLSMATGSQPLPAPAAVGTDQARISEGGQVTVKATWPRPAAGLVFTIVMDTHAVDLDGYDLAQLAVLRVDGGPDLAPVGWDAPAGGHHREGTLTFPTEQGGKPVIGAQTRTIELIIRDVAGVPERVLTWEQ